MKKLPVTFDVSELIPNTDISGIDPYAADTLGDKDGNKFAKHITKQIETEALVASLGEVRESLDDIFTSISEVGKFELSEISLTLEVSAEGGFSLIGSAKAGVKGGITLTFSPKTSEKRASNKGHGKT